jgi:tetratricopeptide (TPR) repeat protein
VILSCLGDHVSHLLTRQLPRGDGRQLVGWVAYDSGEHGVAQRYLTQALAYARHADDHALGAERSFDHATHDDDPAWLAYFDEAYLAARMAQCFRDLGEAGHAARYARRSLDMDGRYVRGRAFNLTLLATAYAAQDEPERACAVGRQALDLTVRLTSARSVGYVRELVRRLRPRADVPAVREFTAEVAERLPAAAARAAPRSR